MNTRSALFRLYDLIMNQGAVTEYYKELSETVGRNEDGHDDKLKELMEYVSRYVPYYAGLKTYNIGDFPVVNKNIIKNGFEEFISSKVDMNSLRKVTTSGSTGTPFTVLHDKKKRVHHTADNLYFMHLAGYTTGSPLYYMRVWNKYCRHGKLSNFLSNIHPVEIGDLSENILMGILHDIGNQKGKKSLLAFASTYEELYKLLRKRDISNLKMGGIDVMISMSEHLSENTRMALSGIFDAPVISRYSNMENGFIAQQLPGETWYLLNNSSYYVELLDMSNNVPVEKEGDLGRIVVTDYYNYGMPMVRYDTGDLGIFEKKKYKGEEIKVLAAVEGRRADMIFKTDGNAVSPHIVTNTMWPYKTIRQWQFIQFSPKGYKFKISGELSKEQQNEIENILRGYLGKNAEFTYEYVSEIPVLASGKRKQIENRMK